MISTRPLSSTPIRMVPITVPKIVPDAAEQAGAADHDGGDDGQLVAGAGDRLGRVEPRREHEGAEPGEETHDHVDARGDRADVQAGEPRRLRIAADRVDLPTVARVAQHDMGEHGEGEEDDHRHRHLSDRCRPWPHQTKPGSKPLIGPPPAKSSAAPRNTDMPPSVTTNGGTLSRVMAIPCTKPAEHADRDRRERGEVPAVARGVLPLADGEAVGQAALRNRRRDEPGQASSEPTDRSMPAVRMTKVMPIASRPTIDTCRMTLKRLTEDRKRGSSDGEHRHQHHEEDQRREAGEERECIDLVGRRGAGTVSRRPFVTPFLMPPAPASVIIDISFSWSPPRAISPVTRPFAHGHDAVADRQHLRAAPTRSR